MTFHDLGTLGTADVVAKKSLNVKINMPWDKFSLKFAAELADLSTGTIAVLQDALISKKDVKIKKEGDELDKFFTKVEAAQKKSPMGFGAEEKAEVTHADKLKGQQMDKGTKVKGGTTYDEKTGRPEGKVVLKDGNEEGLKVPIIIEEQVKSHLTHTGEKVEDEVISGLFKIQNPSKRDRLWDIDIKLKDIGSTSMEKEELSFRELEPEKDTQQEYTIKTEKIAKHLEVKEFVSAMNDPKTESYALKVGEDNKVYFKITLKNVSEAKLTDIEVKKAISEGFSDVDVEGKTAGETKKEEGSLVWTLKELEANSEASVEVRMIAKIADKDSKVKSGAVNVSYKAPTCISGMGIEKFDAYSNNRFFIELGELEEKPDTFDCQLVFQNTSEFMIRLVNADVYDPKDEKTKFVDIDPEEIPPMPGGSEWISKKWQYTTPEANTEPQFRKQCEFFVVADHQISTKGVIDIDEVALAVASIEGELAYDITQLASFRETTFHVTHKVTNSGGDVLNEVLFQESFKKFFVPPKKDEIVVKLGREGKEEQIEVGAEAISIDPDNQEPDHDHVLKVAFNDLIKNEAVGGFKPGDTMTVTYPITSMKPSAQVTFKSDVLYQANTLPAGKALEVRPAVVELAVAHIRRKFRKGKEIKALSGEGNYEITLFVENTGEFNLEGMTVIDKVPDAFQYTDFKPTEPEIVDLEGQNVLSWKLETLEPGKGWSVTYKITGQGEYAASDAQFSL